MNVNFDLFVLYSQVAVFEAGLQNPFNDWRPQHFAQGFSWSTTSVSFGTLDESGHIQVEVHLANEIALKSDARRAILVPFAVSLSELVEVASIVKGQQIGIPKGRYGLVFETGYNNSAMWCRFTFVPRDLVQAEILLADSGLTPQYPLLMEASFAGRPSSS